MSKSPVVYIAHLATYYAVYAVGRTPEEAKRAAADEVIRTNNSGYGLQCDPTVEAINEWHGINVYGPVSVPGAVTEG